MLTCSRPPVDEGRDAVMLVREGRPRDLSWKHSGPLLFGDWGTSRLYVLGLAFYYTGHASVWYLAVMSLLMAAVAWAYTVICRCFPEGGGVYTASRRLSSTLSVIAATLLLCDFIVTAALSTVEGFHYFGTPGHAVVPLSILTISALGVVNWLGARSAGRLALVIAVAAILLSALIGALCLRYIPQGLGTVRADVDGVTSPWARWESLVRIVLALSGIEAVANMTGLMKEPVAKTARRTIWPVLIEVVLLNLVFGVALNALPALSERAIPDYVTYELRQEIPSDKVPEDVRRYRDTAVRQIAEHVSADTFGAEAGRVMGVVSGAVFGLLLLSAVNTAIMAMVSVLYALAHDKELPTTLTKLNYAGVPWLGLIIACLAPSMVLLIEADVKALGELYAIGVVGAIAINVLCCGFNRDLQISPWERRGLWALGGFMTLVELTIVVAKPHATLFAGGGIVTVLGARAALRLSRRKTGAAVPPLPTPAAGWLSELQAQPLKLDPSRPRIMLASRGRYQSEFAVDLARRRRATLFGIYVRTLRVMDINPKAIPKLADDPVAQEALGTTALLAREAGVPFVPVYVTSEDISAEILDYTVTFGCDTLIMGKSRRSLVSRRVQGDVVARVAENLPDEVALITRSADQPHLSPAPAGSTGADPETSSNDPIGHA